MADGLAQKVEHSEVEVVLFDLSISDFEVVKEWNDHVFEWLFLVEKQVVGISINE